MCIIYNIYPVLIKLIVNIVQINHKSLILIWPDFHYYDMVQCIRVVLVI